MRIWDINPGYLNDKSLLGEHCELHGLFSILTKNKKGYSSHPETLRWKGFLSGLYARHELIVQEMTLRNFHHKSALFHDYKNVKWPSDFIDSPGKQFTILRDKYTHKPRGRIPLPKNSQELWAHHKYSVMARGYGLYKKFGPLVASNSLSFEQLASNLEFLLRSPPPERSLQNALLHMWGYISQFSNTSPHSLSAQELLTEIQHLAQKHSIDYILHSTALCELALRR